MSDPTCTCRPTTCGGYHGPTPDLPYNAAHEDADRRLKRGEKQHRCPICGLWVWGYLFHRPPAAPKVRHLGGGHYVVERETCPIHRPA